MQTRQLDLDGYEIEPELLAPVPRAIRRRVPQSGQQDGGAPVWGELIKALIWLLLVYTVPLLAIYAYISLPVWFGQIVPAKIRYFAKYSESLPKVEALRDNRIMAHLTYDWNGSRHQEFLWVDTGLMKTHPNQSVVPVKVLGPWLDSVVWPDGHGDAYWQRRVSLIWLASWRIGLLFLAFCGIIGASIPLDRRRDMKVTREGVPMAGRIVSYRNWLGRLIKGDLPKKGMVSLRYEYLRPTGAGNSVPRTFRAYRHFDVRYARLLPPAGQPVTLLRLPGWRGELVGDVLYPLSAYEATLPPIHEKTAIKPTPSPKTE